MPLRVFGRLFNHAPVSLDRPIRLETNFLSALHIVWRPDRPRSAFILRVQARHASLTLLVYPVASISIRAIKEAVRALVHSKDAL